MEVKLPKLFFLQAFNIAIVDHPLATPNSIMFFGLKIKIRLYKSSVSEPPPNLSFFEMKAFLRKFFSIL